jgi:hypothetical protein
MTGEVTAAFVAARRRARTTPTRPLVRLERGYRRDYAAGARLGRPALTSWAAVRAELRERGIDTPDPDQQPRRRWARWLSLGLGVRLGAGLGLLLVAGIAACAPTPARPSTTTTATTTTTAVGTGTTAAPSVVPPGALAELRTSTDCAQLHHVAQAMRGRVERGAAGELDYAALATAAGRMAELRCQGDR